MRNRNFRILEYDKIINELADHASSELGRKKCLKLRPCDNLYEITQLQEETSAALSRLYRFGNLSFSGIKDIRPLLHLASIDGTLSSTELLDIARLLEVARTAVSYSDEAKNEDSLADADCIEHFFQDLDPVYDLEREIRRCILSENEIADDASSALKTIRRTIAQTNGKIRSELNKIVSNQKNQTMLQDTLVTLRNNRYCIPVKAEYRSSFPGMIHDQSATGSTLFIEPMSVVNLNNELTELAAKEKVEIERILSDLTKQVKFNEEILDANLILLSQLDFIFARARYARDYDGTKPLFNENGYINIKKGRHPLLDKKNVVPIDISLGGDHTM